MYYAKQNKASREKEMKKASQISESIEIGILLAAAGGFMDAYSYIQRGGVFANAQTGNILLLGLSLSEGKFSSVIQYLFPILAFVIGIALSDVIHNKQLKCLHWRQVSILSESLILAAVAFIPLTMNFLANALISFSCGIQAESFRKVHGKGVATTVCTGNLKSGVENLCAYFQSGNKHNLKSSLLYFSMIFFFIAGAIAGSLLIRQYDIYSIIFCAAIQFTAFLIMFIDREKRKSICR